MKNLIKFVLLTAGSAAIFAACSPEPKAIELFNGHNLDGWVGYLADPSLDTEAEFTVADGVIRLSGKLGYIHTEKTWTDFKLEVEWRWPEVATNSGIFLRTQPEYKALPKGFECQLKAGDAGDIFCLDGASVAEGSMSAKKLPSNEKPVGEWNRAEIICRGGEITVVINGEEQNHVSGASLSEGYVGLQSEGEAVEFRNIKLTPII